MKTWFAVPVLMCLMASAVGQQPSHDHLPAGASTAHGSQSPGHSPYAGLQQRPIKALSAEQVADLREGKGMALALPAELNGYPGPAHVLELADRLGLEPAQIEKTRQLSADMKTQARAIGEELIAAEADLDRLFKNRRASALAVAEVTSRAAQAQGRLRASHLKYHLTMVEVLTPAQVEQYNRLRGYL